MIYEGYDDKISIEITCGKCNGTRTWAGRGPEFWAKLRKVEDLAAAMNKLYCQCGGKASRIVFDRRLRTPPSLGQSKVKSWDERWVQAAEKPE